MRLGLFYFFLSVSCVYYIFSITQTVELNANTDLGDYWVQQYGTPETPSEPHLSVESIEGVEPLDKQFGVAHPKTVPDALHGPLFGQPEPTEAELEQAGGDPEQVQPMHTYAILDAAKVVGLPELLAASGLDHHCLFKGEAFEELAEVAPWIVRIEDGNSFVRKLFTHSDAGWHLWDKEPGIYLRSRGSLGEMWRHFRKFTKVKDEQGKWYYFRFWEKPVPYALSIPSGSGTPVAELFTGVRRVLYPYAKACRVVSVLTSGRSLSHVRGNSDAGFFKKLGVAHECGFLHPCYIDENFSHTQFVSQCWGICEPETFTDPTLIRAICKSVLSVGASQTLERVGAIEINPSKVGQRKAAFVLNRRGGDT